MARWSRSRGAIVVRAAPRRRSSYLVTGVLLLFSGHGLAQLVLLRSYVTSAGTRHRNTPGPAVQYRYRSRPVSRFLLRSPAFFVRELSAVFELLSSSVNFLVYCVVLRRFRQRFLAAVATSCTARRTDLAPGRPVHSVT